MKIKKPFKKLQDSDNIAELLNEDQLRHVGQKVCQWYEADKESRSGWERKTKESLKLATQVMEKKTYPWQNASNVKFPLLTIASLQFSARAYPALVKAPDLVKYRVMGADPQGQKAARAARVSRFMSWQLLEDSETWEEDQDKLFITLPIMGCVFKKTYYDPLNTRVKSRLVLPHDLVIHYWAKDLERSRVTEKFELYAREIRERQLRGLYIDRDYTQFEAGSTDQRAEDETGSDKRQGLDLPFWDDETPRTVLEAHCFFDFDGDGYEEPYIVTVDYESSMPLRIINRWREVITEQSIEIDRLQKQNFLLTESLPSPEQLAQLDAQQQSQVLAEAQRIEAQVLQNQQRIEELGQEAPKVIKISPKLYYTKYSFIPAPDGGFYDIGFGQLLGPLNSSVNTIINQIVDAGTLQNGNSGFIAKGARISGGTNRFEPFEWKRVSVAGATLKESIVPLPVNEPSNVLYQLLGLLINYSERVSSVTDIMSGENPGQNTPAYNMKAMLEQGMQVFNGVFKRIYRSYREELRKVYMLDAEFISGDQYVEIQDQPFKLLRGDFAGDPKDVLPAADPNAFSNVEKLSKAQFLASRVATQPGYNSVAVEKKLLEAMDIDDVQDVYPTTPDGQLVIQPPPNPEIEMDKADLQRKTLEGKLRGETEMFKAESDRILKEAQAVKAMAEAGAIEEEVALERLRLLDEHFKRNHEQYIAQMDENIKEMDVIIQEYKVREAKEKSEQQRQTNSSSE